VTLAFKCRNNFNEFNGLLRSSTVDTCVTTVIFAPRGKTLLPALPPQRAESP
jgi:hypothetical protein